MGIEYKTSEYKRVQKKKVN